ncbi:hypothetical protein [Sinorhizobium meliloti]|nr:hypothetical protein [Sinorhizobium meliloti]AEG53163.1 hypothetical protein Sinme_1417 [Sinorhizobium meliloti AK83]SEI56364.1 hypothetical protein SAMN04244575_01066 [Sinorhizobium meliloti]
MATWHQMKNADGMRALYAAKPGIWKVVCDKPHEMASAIEFSNEADARANAARTGGRIVEPSDLLKAYLQFGKAGEPMQTVSVPVKESPLWFHDKGLQQTASGYGLKLATPYMVKWNGRWRRVYCCQISNAGTCYIGKPGDWLAIVDIHR